MFDAVAGATIAAAINASMTHDPPGTPPELRRTVAQRRADALYDIARLALASPGAPDVAGARPHVVARVNLTDLLTAHLIVTTTAVSLHGENETRIISLPTDDSAGQTKAILLALAGDDFDPIDVTDWHRLQQWLDGAERQASPARPAPPVLRAASLTPPIGHRRGVAVSLL